MTVGLEQLGEATPLVRTASPEEIAAAVVFAISREASFLHGAVIPVV